MSNYTLIAYKPDADDNCMGCHVGSYGSRMETICKSDPETIIRYWAGFLCKNELKEVNDADYEIALLIDGKLASGGCYQNMIIEYDYDYDRDGLIDTSNSMKTKAKELSKTLIAEERARRQAAERAKIEEQARQAEQAERREYERLQQKFKK